MEYLALCSKVLYDRDILEKQNEIVDLKKRLYCSHGKPPLHIYYHYCSPNITIGEYGYNKNIKYTSEDNNCIKLMDNILKQITNLFGFDRTTHLDLFREAIESSTPFIYENYSLLSSDILEFRGASYFGISEFVSSPFWLIITNFKKIIKGDTSFKYELTEIIYSNLLKFTNLPKHSKEKTDEVIEYIYEIYPIIYDEEIVINYDGWVNSLSNRARFENILEKLTNFICYKIFGIYYIDLYDNTDEILPKLSKKFEVIYHHHEYNDSDEIIKLCVDCKKRKDEIEEYIEEYKISKRNKRKREKNLLKK